jgi:1,4-dihydroxy-2-naphthoyl-CoA hydrolase
MTLWRQTPNLEQLNASLHNTLGERLGIRVETGDERSLNASRVVDSRTHQP